VQVQADSYLDRELPGQVHLYPSPASMSTIRQLRRCAAQRSRRRPIPIPAAHREGSAFVSGFRAALADRRGGDCASDRTAEEPIPRPRHRARSPRRPTHHPPAPRVRAYPIIRRTAARSSGDRPGQRSMMVCRSRSIPARPHNSLSTVLGFPTGAVRRGSVSACSGMGLQPPPVRFPISFIGLSIRRLRVRDPSASF